MWTHTSLTFETIIGCNYFLPTTPFWEWTGSRVWETQLLSCGTAIIRDCLKIADWAGADIAKEVVLEKPSFHLQYIPQTGVSKQIDGEQVMG